MSLELPPTSFKPPLGASSKIEPPSDSKTKPPLKGNKTLDQPSDTKTKPSSLKETTSSKIDSPDLKNQPPSLKRNKFDKPPDTKPKPSSLKGNASSKTINQPPNSQTKPSSLKGNTSSKINPPSNSQTKPSSLRGNTSPKTLDLLKHPSKAKPTLRSADQPKPDNTPRKPSSKPIDSTYVLDDSHILVAVFNVKGGVAKTTLSINMAYAFAKTCNVLLTEVDPQCNIRQFFARQLPLNTDEDDEDDEDESDTDVTPVSHIPTPPRGIVVLNTPVVDTGLTESKSGFEMSRQSARVHKGVKTVNPDVSTADVGFTNNLYDATRNYMIGGVNKIPTCHELPNPRLHPHKVWFLPGSQNIIELERSISLQDRDTAGIGHHQIGAFRRMMVDTMTALDCRVAVIDFGPHAGLLNRVFVTSCDLVIPPCFPDSLSFNASKTLLQNVLPNWFKWFDEFANHPQNSSMKKRLPYILPFAVTNFHTRSQSMYKSASEWVTRLQTLSANDELVTKHRIPITVTAFAPPIVDSNVVCISRHEDGLNGAAHIQGIPIIELGSTGLSKAQQHVVAETRAEFYALAHMILEIASHKSPRRTQKRKRTTSG